MGINDRSIRREIKIHSWNCYLFLVIYLQILSKYLYLIISKGKLLTEKLWYFCRLVTLVSAITNKNIRVWMKPEKDVCTFFNRCKLYYRQKCPGAYDCNAWSELYKNIASLCEVATWHTGAAIFAKLKLLLWHTLKNEDIMAEWKVDVW